VELLTRGLPPPDPCSLCPLSSTEFVELPPPPRKNPGYATAVNSIVSDYIACTILKRAVVDEFVKHYVLVFRKYLSEIYFFYVL
jgi:hypothetical protein